MALIDDLSQLLPIEHPFGIKAVEKDEANLRVNIILSVSQEAIPVDCRVHSHYGRKWEHLKLFQYRTFVRCDIPTYQHKKTGELAKPAISFSRDRSRFTLRYEAEVMRLMDIHPQRVESLYHHHTRPLEFDQPGHTPQNIAFGETSTRKGHDHVTTFRDIDEQCIVGIYNGKSSEAVGAFKQDHPYPEAIRNVSIDMSPAFVSGVSKHLPQATVTFDKWHVTKLLDELTQAADEFKALVKLPMNQLCDFYKRENHERFSAQLAFVADPAQEKLQDNPITKAIREHFDGIANYADSKINNGIMEGTNSKIQTIKHIARGLRHKHTFKKMIRLAFQNNALQVNS